MTKKPLVIISGPTGVGKTEISVKLAKMVNGSIISADSMQVYKGFDIGTAKTMPHEMDGIKHYLIDELEPTEEFSVYEFKTRAKKYVEEILSENKLPIIVGGTGFYIQSVLYDIDFTEEETDTEYRRILQEKAECFGAEYLHNLLSEADPESAKAIHPNNIKRVIRALEYYHETGERISEHNERERARMSPYNFAYFVLNRSRDEVYSRIDKRVDKMISEGLVSEVKGLLDSGVPKECLAMQGLDYKDIVTYLEGKITLDEAIRLLKLNTRHFAKRQLTWFRRERDVSWLDYGDFDSQDSMLLRMTEILAEKGIV